MAGARKACAGTRPNENMLIVLVVSATIKRGSHTGGHRRKFLGPFGNLPGPLLCLPVNSGSFFRIQVKTYRQLTGRLPLAAFVGESQLIDRAQHTGLSEKNRF